MQHNGNDKLLKYFDSQLLDAFQRNSHQFDILAQQESGTEKAEFISVLRALYDIKHQRHMDVFNRRHKNLINATVLHKNAQAICQLMVEKGWISAKHSEFFEARVFTADTATTNRLQQLPDSLLARVAENLTKTEIQKLRLTSRFFSNEPFLKEAVDHQSAPLFSCGSTRTYFICDKGKKLVTSDIKQRHIEFEKLSFPEGTTITQVATGHIVSYCTTKEGHLYFWRNQGQGSLEKNDCLPELFPLPAQELALDVAVSQNNMHRHLLVLTNKNRILTMGHNNYDQLGLRPGKRDTNKMYVIQPPATIIIKKIAAGGGHSLFLTTEGQVYGWGRNKSGQAGTHNADSIPTPTLIKFPVSVKAIQIAAGYKHSLALTSTGQVFTWGEQSSGKPAHLPTKVELPEGAKVTDVVAGRFHSLCLTQDGRVFTWDHRNNNADAATPTPAIPTLVSFPEGTRISKIASGGEHSFCVTTDGRVFAWGHYEFGQQGEVLPQDTNQSLPTEIHSLSVKNDSLKLLHDVKEIKPAPKK